MDVGLKGKVAIVTGASQGIGAAIALALAQEGCRVMITARNQAALLSQVKKIHNLGGQADMISLDLSETTAPQQLIDATLKIFGGVDIIVGNAGSARMGDFLELTDDLWVEGFGLKFFGNMRLVRAAWPYLKQVQGSVTFIAGSAGRTPYETSAITGSVNAAVLNLTKTLAARGLNDGVRVNAINPGAIRTERYIARIEDSIKNGAKSVEAAEEQLAKDRNKAPVGEPHHVAHLVCFLSGTSGAHMNGAILDIDGGKTKTL